MSRGIAWSALKVFCADYLRYSGAKGALSLVLLLLLGFTEGAALMLLLPALELAGLSGRDVPLPAAAGEVLAWLGRLGLPTTLPGVIIFYVILASLHALLTQYRSNLDSALGVGYVQHWRDRLYARMAAVSWQEFLLLRPAEITHVLTQEVQRLQGGARQLSQLVATAVITAVYTGGSFLLAPLVTGVALACGTAMILALSRYNRVSRATGHSLGLRGRAMFTLASEHLNGMKVAKSYGLEREHVRHFLQVSHEITAEQQRFARAQASAQAWFKIGAAVVLGGLLYLGSTRLALSGPVLVLMVYVFARVLPRVSTLQQGYQQILHALPAHEACQVLLQRLEAAGQALPSQEGEPMSIQAGVDLEEVSFRYQEDGPWVLERVSLRIPARQMTAIVGASGSGKSTLADAIMGLLTPASGRVLIDGVPLMQAETHRLRQAIGYVPQDTFLFHDTVRANLLWARPGAEEAALWEALETAAAADFVRALPEGLDTMLGERGVRVSGGERQRIALARALLRKPALLLLDEATSALDAQNEQRIQEAVERFHGALTVVVIAHRLSTVRQADQIIVLEGGRVVEQGTWGELAGKEQGMIRGLASLT
ncbi:MAG: ABC transporter ATP-binding protein [Candidatus Hydrogenedentes bacterium]|nr:ABC transporter ATP-binding protein [Candidatus Hydrogenedentota bacterium]